MNMQTVEMNQPTYQTIHLETESPVPSADGIALRLKFRTDHKILYDEFLSIAASVGVVAQRRAGWNVDDREWSEPPARPDAELHR